MEPILSYRIWFTQRSGSTLLCKALESTGIAGKPGEFFNFFDYPTLCDKFTVSNYDDFKAALWQHGMTSNGVMGIKTSMRTNIYKRQLAEILRLREMQAADHNHELIWSDLLPNCRHLYLTRRNKVRQAVSWWKAIQDQTWHLQQGENRQQTEHFYSDKYDFDALSHLFKELMLKECATQSYFEQHGIVPFTIIYEDFIMDFEGTVKQIMDYLGISYEKLTVGLPYYKQTADAHSEEWVQRFRADLQPFEASEMIW